MKRRDPMQVAVVGHTNTGKTSLLRTLARDSGFGEVSDRPATTRGVAAIELLAEDEPVLRCFDTPGLEDAVDLAGYLVPDGSPAEDPVSRIEAFVAGDHDAGRFEQEAKVLRQMLRVDAALYVIDAREPVLAKHRAELRLLADCGRPLLPVLNFVAAADAGFVRSANPGGFAVSAVLELAARRPPRAVSQTSGVAHDLKAYGRHSDNPLGIVKAIVHEYRVAVASRGDRVCQGF